MAFDLLVLGLPLCRSMIVFTTRLVADPDLVLGLAADFRAVAFTVVLDFTVIVVFAFAFLSFALTFALTFVAIIIPRRWNLLNMTISRTVHTH